MYQRTLLYKSKVILESGLVRDIVIWKVVPSNKDYPDGIRYKLLLADPFWKKTLLLFCNHAPKGHLRMESSKIESSYCFTSLRSLIEEFRDLANVEERIYNESYEN